MLNELHDLAQSLKAVDVAMDSWHRHFTNCPKAVTYYALLDQNGELVNLEPIRERERIERLRKWEVGAGFSFPAFNVPPLLAARTDHIKKRVGETDNAFQTRFTARTDRIKARMAAFKKAITGKKPPATEWVQSRLRRLGILSVSGWRTNTKADKGRDEWDKVQKCLTTIPQKLRAILDEPPQSCRAIGELIDRSQKSSADNFFNQLRGWLERQIQTDPANAGEWFDLLFLHGAKKAGKACLVLEVSDRSAFDSPANHKEVLEWINQRLHVHDAVEVKPKRQRATFALSQDAYAGTAERLNDKFPMVNLPVLGKVNLRAMHKDSQCQFRYGVAESESFPVGMLTRQAMKDALQWIGDLDRRDKTWCDVSSLSGKKGLLFAYPSRLPEIAPELAGLIVGFQDDADPDGARFEACAARVTTSLTELVRKQPHEAPMTEVRVFVLTKPDGFRTKVLSSSRYSVERLLTSANEWMACCRNVPSLLIRQFGAKKGDKPFWAEPVIPYPAEVVSCLNTAWERAGTHAEQVPGFGIGDGLGLLLEDGVVLKAIATRAIRTLITNSLSLVLALAHAQRQELVHLMGKKYGKQALLLPSIFGLLLAKLGHMKGDYMKGPPFLVGRLLSLADQLHLQYCQGVRKGRVPPQLVGNALMATALEQPTKAVAMLSQRILPYQAWARTVQGGDEVRLAKYFLGELGRVSAEMKDLELPPICGDTEKAEMLLGYLARSEKDKDSEPISPTSEGTST